MHTLPVLSPVALSVKMLCGQEPLETFEFEIFLEDVLSALFYKQLDLMKKAEAKFTVSTKGLQVSRYVHASELTYSWKFLQ